MLRDADTAELRRQDRLTWPGFVLDLAGGDLRDAGDGRPVELRAQALRVLLVLGEHAGQVVSKETLMRRVWGDLVVTEDSLVQAIGDIRRVLGEGAHQRLKTLPRRGYLLAVDEPAVVGLAASPAGEASPVAVLPVEAAASSTPPAAPARWWPALLGVALLLAAIGGATWAASKLQREGPAPARSLAIMPFESAEGTDAWFVDGIASDLSATLGSWSGLSVVGRGSTAAYTDQRVDPRTVGRELNVRHLLMGKARREGDRVRLAMSLVDTRSGREAWSELRDVPRAELGAWVGDVAGGIARTLALKLGDAIGASTRTLAANEVQADDLAMQGMAEMLRSVSRESFDGSRRTFEQALAIDGNCVRCLAGVALSNTALVSWEWADDRDAAIARAEAMLARLDLIAPGRQLTIMAAFNITLIKRDWPAAMTISDRLAAHYPNDPSSHHYRCSSLLRLGRFEEGIEACARAQRISPRDSRVATWQGLTSFLQFQLGRWRQAEQNARASVLGNPRVAFYSVVLAGALAEQGRTDEAKAVIRDVIARHPDYVVSRIPGYWQASNEQFIAGRNRLAARAKELGLPP